jgi:hypothetical protein
MVVTDNGPVGVERESRSVDPKGAQTVRVEVEMGAGELKMRGGAATLLDADFRYRASDGKPEVRYDVAGSRGTLTVRQPRQRSFGGNNRNEWDLRVNEDIPLDISIKMGAGQGVLDLGTVALHNLNVDIGAGELKLNLTGHPRNNVEVQVHGGVGQATVRLPRRARLEVEAHGGIGDISTHGLTKRGDRWVNEPSEEAAAAMHVNVSGGIGSINLICE